MDALFLVADGEDPEVVALVLDPVVVDAFVVAVDPEEEDATEPAGMVEREESLVNAAVSPVTFLHAVGTVGFEPLLKLTAAHCILSDKIRAF